MADIPAFMWVGWTDPNDTVKDDLIPMHTRAMVSAKALYSDLPVIAYKKGGRVFKTGDVLYVDALTDSDGTWVVATSCISIPVTVKNTRTGKYENATLELTGKYKFTTDAASLICLDSMRHRIAWYTIPEGMALVIGQKRAHNSRLLIYMTSV